MSLLILADLNTQPCHLSAISCKIRAHYDCAHDFAHRDRYNLKDDREKEEIAVSYTESLDLADRDINANGDIYQVRVLRGEFP